MNVAFISQKYIKKLEKCDEKCLAKNLCREGEIV